MKVQVKTPSRLHMGIIDLNSELGRIYGSLGLALEYPNVVLEACEAETLVAEGVEAERAMSFARSFLSHFMLRGGCRINIQNAIPRHVGLGSGTQLSLAVGVCMAKLFDVKVCIRELSAIMGRKHVSGVGTAVFEYGGFVVDGGLPYNVESKKVDRRLPPPMIFHHPFPEDWLLVVAIPNLKKGLSGSMERRAFRTLPKAPRRYAEKMCRLLVMKMLPSLIDKDIEGFGSALTELQRLTGECFQKAQGGIFSSRTVEECVNLMLKEKAHGAGQSSWGPTVYCVAGSLKAAERLKKAVEDYLADHMGGSVFYTKANNQGASIEV